jgi:type VI protein secretion system component Hcp
MPEVLLDLGDDKKNFPGESAIEGFEKLIICNSFSVGANQPVDLGRGVNRTTGAITISEVSLGRTFDTSSTLLIHSMFSGKVFPKMTVRFLKATAAEGKAFEEFLSVELHNVIISNTSYSGGVGGDGLSETMSLAFTKINFIYKVQKADKGTLDGKQTATFDLLKQKAEKG